MSARQCGETMNIRDITAEQHEELGYRRGFDQAIACVIYLMDDGQTLDEIKRLKELVFKWRHTPLKKKGEARLHIPIDMFSAEINRKILKRKK
jgi:hypothetical protein